MHAIKTEVQQDVKFTTSVRTVGPILDGRSSMTDASIDDLCGTRLVGDSMGEWITTEMLFGRCHRRCFMDCQGVEWSKSIDHLKEVKIPKVLLESVESLGIGASIQCKIKPQLIMTAWPRSRFFLGLQIWEIVDDLKIGLQRRFPGQTA
jgi:hypothetical protein